MANHDIVVIGASAGSIEALVRLVGELPPALPASLFVVVHFPPSGQSVLPDILQKSGPLPASYARDGESIRHGHIYVAPPAQHLRSSKTLIELYKGPHENGFRPAIDPLFRSAAQCCGSRVIGIVLSGVLDDGCLGIESVRRGGGITVVQDPGEAAFADMSLNALDKRGVDYILPAVEVGRLLIRLVDQSAFQEGGFAVSKEAEQERELIRDTIERFQENSGGPSTTTVLTCPECGGVMWELREGDLSRYRCHVGHSFSSESFLNEHAKTLEATLWTAVRALEERGALLARMAIRAQEYSSYHSQARFAIQARNAKRNADIIRIMLLMNSTLNSVESLESD